MRRCDVGHLGPSGDGLAVAPLAFTHAPIGVRVRAWPAHGAQDQQLRRGKVHGVWVHGGHSSKRTVRGPDKRR